MGEIYAVIKHGAVIKYGVVLKRSKYIDMKLKDDILLEQAYKSVYKENRQLPSDWDKGFGTEFRIGNNGTETPFQKNEKWYLYVWNPKEKKHYYYSYSDDMFYPDTEFDSL